MAKPAIAKPNVKFNVPSSFIQTVASADLVGGTGLGSPYIQFTNEKSKNIKELRKKIKGLLDDDIVLISSEDPIQVQPLYFSLMALYQYWFTMNAQFEPNKVWFKYEDAPANANEGIESIIIALLDDEAKLCRCTWRGPKCTAIKVANKALQEANDDDVWGSKGEEYHNTLFMENAALRFFIEVELVRRVSKSNGLPYYQAKGTVNPTTSTEWKKFMELFQQEDYEKNMDACTQDFNSRKKYLEGLAK